jgi:HK97 family phage prohead protease
MQHLVLKSTTVSTDQDLGQFEAVVSSWEADRQGDTIDPHAFDKTISAWQDSGRNLPLLFEHSTKAVGYISPFSMHPTDQGLVVYGEVDRSTDEGKQVWTQIKANTAGFSIGFMAESRKSPDGGRVLTAIDLLEISATSTPMNPATRALNWKSTGTPPFTDSDWAAHDQRRHDRELKKREDEELKKFLAELEAKAERKRLHDRPVIVKRIEVG